MSQYYPTQYESYPPPPPQQPKKNTNWTVIAVVIGGLILLLLAVNFLTRTPANNNNTVSTVTATNSSNSDYPVLANHYVGYMTIYGTGKTVSLTLANIVQNEGTFTGTDDTAPFSDGVVTASGYVSFSVTVQDTSAAGGPVSVVITYAGTVQANGGMKGDLHWHTDNPNFIHDQYGTWEVNPG